ncbi:hypothetical protein ACFZ8Y_18095, partial [Acinetobacter baumannii]
PQNDVTLKMPAFEWVHVQLHQQKGMISLSPPTICNSAVIYTAHNRAIRYSASRLPMILICQLSYRMLYERNGLLLIVLSYQTS